MSKDKDSNLVESAARNAATLCDGCNSQLVKGAEFDGIFEIPIIKKPKKLVIPDNLVPFSKMNKVDPKSFAVCEYENDKEFSELLINPEAVLEELKNYQGFISPDCSVYRDMPLAVQITNIYRNRAIGYFFQSKGLYVIPCVRWGDERTYTKNYLPEKIAFSGVEKGGIVSIGSYGQIKNKVNRFFFEEGLDSMIVELEPKVVLVYSKIPDEIKNRYQSIKFIEYPDWTSTVRSE